MSSTTPPSAATPAAGCSRCPGLRDPIVTYRLTDGDLSRLARGLVHLGEALLAAGATELYPSVIGAPVVRDVDGLAVVVAVDPPAPTS